MFFVNVFNWIKGIHYPDKKQFVWSGDIIKDAIDKSQISFPTIYADYYTNVSEDDADELAVWARSLWRYSDLEYVWSNADKHLNTNNLVKFKMEYENNKHFIMYALIDLGYKDPKISHEQLKQIITM